MDWLWALLFLGVGIVMIFRVIRGVKWGIESVSWPSTDGQITHSEITWSRDAEGGGYGEAEIFYVYKVAGKSYSASVRHIGCGDLDPLPPYRRIVSKYPLGARVKVYFDPSKPEVATLETGVSARGIVGSLVITVFSIFLGVAFFQNTLGKK